VRSRRWTKEARVPHLSVTCPHCAKRNDITASEVPEPIDIYCSNCHAPLGKWSELEQQTKGLGRFKSERAPLN
jgi:RNase P subunit RPR2